MNSYVFRGMSIGMILMAFSPLAYTQIISAELPNTPT